MNKKTSRIRKAFSLGLALLMTLSAGISGVQVQGKETQTEDKTVKVRVESVEHAIVKLNDSEEQEINLSPGSEVKIDVETEKGYQLDDIWAEDSEGYKTEMTQKEASYYVIADTDLTIKLAVSESGDKKSGDEDPDKSDSQDEKTSEQRSPAYDVEKLHEILSSIEDRGAANNEISVASADGDENALARSASAYVGQYKYISHLERSVAPIDMIQYNADGSWTKVKSWSEGVFGLQNGEVTYCCEPNQPFAAGNMLCRNATDYYSADTVKTICMMMYYYDEYIKCGGTSWVDDYLIKQCIVWSVVNDVRQFIPGITLEYGNATLDGKGHYLSDHLGTALYYGAQWAADSANRKCFTCRGYIYENPYGQDQSQWEYSYEPAPGKVSLKKVSSNPYLSDENPCYSLEGAEYGVYTDEGCTNQVATLTTDADGNTNTVEVDEGTYYVKEINPSKGYALDLETYAVDVSSGETASVTSEEVPLADAFGISLIKIDQDSNGRANVKNLEGAQFEVKYYAVNPDDYKGLEDLDGIDATRIWVLETKNKDGKYYAALDDEYKVSGDDFYYNDDEAKCIPIGVITIEEIAAPEGYKLEGATFTSDTMTGPVDGKYFAKVLGDGEEARLDGGNSLTASDQSIRGGIKVAKWDKESNAQSPQGEATLESTTIEIINKNDYEVVVDGQAYGKDQTVMTLTTDANGDAQTAHDALPYGLFEVKETGAPSGYLNTGDSISQEVFIAEDGVIVDLNNDTNAIKNNVIRGGVKLGKWDNEFNAQTPQGNATLEGAEFAIISENSNKVIVNGKSYQKGETVATLKTDANGNAQTSNSLLPYGTYTLKETKAPTGYLNKGTNITQKFSIRENGVIIDLNKDATAIKNNVIRGGVKLGKWDNESNTQKAQGAATLEGAEFEIVNQSSHDVIVNGKTYKRGQVVATLVTNKKGIAESAKDLLPYGKYSYEETKAPKGYLATGSGLTGIFTIKENGVIVDLNKKETAIKNNVIRGDITFTKSDAETSERMANIPFKITSNTTGESHIIYTDENGYYSSESKYVKHSENTNAGKAKSGTWFGLDADGKQVLVKDSVGAFPYDTYTIQELRCDANADKALFKGVFTISMPGFTLDYGTITNADLAMQTTAKDATSNIHTAYASKEVTLVDTVFYTGLKKNTSYTVKGVLMDKETGGKLLDINGNEITAETTFKTVTKNGLIDVTFVFDGTGMEGKDVVVFEECYDKDGNLVIDHKDIDDKGQTISFEKNPEIKTSAKDSETQDHISAAKEKVSIVDTVTYKNLTVGKKYTISGTLVDKETGKAMKDSDGDKITAETSFTAKETDGTVEVTFTFDASDYAGKTMVVFEDLYRNGKLVATHSDLEDEGQTIYFPEVKTTAKDSETDGSLSQAKENVTIVDTVAYKNLIPGKKYTLQGTLMDKKTGKKLLDADGKEVTSEASFTAEKTEGEVDITFTFNASTLAGKTSVVFENLYYNKNLVATHSDLEDEGQSIHFPEIKTRAKDAVSDSQNALPSKKTTIIDTVKYTNLIVGKTYIVKGILMDKDTKEPFLNAEGNQIAAETSFTAAETSGEVEIKFAFDSSALKGKTLVVFEDLYESEHKVATHADIIDKDQSVHFPEIKTTASDKEDGDHTVTCGQVTIVDSIKYENLVPGKEYKLSGVLMDKSTGEKVLVDKKEVTAETSFTPKKANGSVEVTFTFDASSLEKKSLVVFEKLYDVKGNELANHEDINDEDQTVTVSEKTKIVTNSPNETKAAASIVKTGDVANAVPYIVLLGLAIVATSVIVKKKLRPEGK